MSAIRDEIMHHILPATTSAATMFAMVEQYLQSILVGVSVYVITRGISWLLNKAKDKLK